MNEKQIIKKAMSSLGGRKSKAKAKSSRSNGRLGGRPKILGKGKTRQA